MTQAVPLATLYGPVAEDMVLVEDLLESTKKVEISALKRMLDHALEAKGKRLRPALVLLAGTFGDYNLNRLVPLGAAIELLHTASLVHDDVVDGAASRRGRPTMNSLFDNAITVLLGDYLFANAAEMVTRTGSIHVTRLFALALMKMTSGELDQDDAAFDVGRDIQHYLWRIGGKTAALFANATEGGASLAGCDRDSVEALRSYGYSVGMAFQIVDDILDFNGDEAEMGKPVGGDLREGTVTLPALLYLERYPKDNPIKRFFTARRNREEHLQEALEGIRTAGVLEDSMEMAREYIRRGTDALNALPSSPARQSMVEIGSYVLARRS
ncbi:MAG: polyprenyl synthetase family protein [Dehalococcoidia bacterium]|nr:MAG: polyprenyl synthetase family protein [bacterium]MCE7927903.1 polyprenyl synthetase family protein [Chloroflexi bacterium CFX7]MCK6564964.1 polyprenyl synthetase family protein [Dehalococcoidia bacterium]MCL4232307.1 polyprenyl synthetase family protein [Dehalococcoidia bacterium]NUQ56100.1 polyprenyl synthetase family protein [Dehalococcoidia bacterium]